MFKDHKRPQTCNFKMFIDTVANVVPHFKAIVFIVSQCFAKSVFRRVPKSKMGDISLDWDDTESKSKNPRSRSKEGYAQ